MNRLATLALAALLFPASLAVVVAGHLLTLDDLSFDLDPFEVDLQLHQRNDGSGLLATAPRHVSDEAL